MGDKIRNLCSSAVGVRMITGVEFSAAGGQWGYWEWRPQSLAIFYIFSKYNAFLSIL